VNPYAVVYISILQVIGCKGSPLLFRPGEPTLCGSRPLVIPY